MHHLLSPQAGVPIRLFHKEIEAYLVAEGLFADELTEEGVYSSRDFFISRDTLF